MPFLLLLLVLPLVEIALFVAVGGWIGVWGVLGLVVLAALAGVSILRGRFGRLPGLLNAGGDPARLLAQGALSALGAVLLIVPGFLSDAVGLALLLPPVQRLIADRLAARATVRTWRDGGVIEGEYSVEDAGEDAGADPGHPRPPHSAEAPPHLTGPRGH